MKQTALKSGNSLATASPMGATAMDVDGNEIADIVAVTDNEALAAR